MSELLQFFVSFEIKEKEGQNVETRIQYASNTIGDKAKYKFRVVGEAKIFAIFEVKKISVVTMVTSEIIRNGCCNVTCTSLTDLGKWQKLVGSASSHYDLPYPPCTLSGNVFLWFEVGYDHGISKEEFDVLWEKGTQSMIHQLREGEIEIAIFKVLGERRPRDMVKVEINELKIHGFTCKKQYEDWETHLWNYQGEDKIYKNAKLVTKI